MNTVAPDRTDRSPAPSIGNDPAPRWGHPRPTESQLGRANPSPVSRLANAQRPSGSAGTPRPTHQRALRRSSRWAFAAAAGAATLLTSWAAEVPEAGTSAGPTANEYVATLFVFMLATFVGLDVIRRVSRLLHTPLMSLTNAISAIAVVGSLLIAGQRHGAEDWSWINLLGLVAITASVTNIVSGFLITDRMLKMFRKREAKKP